MQFQRNLPVLSALLMLFVIQACHAHTDPAKTTADTQLMCYVCENCAKITKLTPLEACNEQFFTTTTTTDPATTSTATITTDSAPITTTDVTMSSTESTTSITIDTDPTPPRPPTIGPPVTTTAMPTPPNPGTVVVPVAIEDDSSRTPPILTTTPAITDVSTLNQTDVSIINGTTITELPNNSSSTPTSLNRQLRQVINTDVTYHCYRVQKSQNGTSVIERGCSRVSTMEGVCSQLKVMNAGANLSKCFPCSNSRCNGSSSLSVSIMTLFAAVVATLLYRK